MRPAKFQELRELLEDSYARYARAEFIQDDPIQVPRSYSAREDQEVMGFLTATIAWGQRTTIINNARKLSRLMDDTPHGFVMEASEAELKSLRHFVHRTFNGEDLTYFIKALRALYARYGDLERAFTDGAGEQDMAATINGFRKRFFSLPHPARTEKHVADPLKGSSAKRINMFLRWMVRPQDRGIDLGLWKRLDPENLHVPLDVHTGNIARELGLLDRKQNDWKAVVELTETLRQFDASDPIRFDIALFGLGAYAGAEIS